MSFACMSGRELLFEETANFDSGYQIPSSYN